VRRLQKFNYYYVINFDKIYNIFIDNMTEEIIDNELSNSDITDISGLSDITDNSDVSDISDISDISVELDEQKQLINKFSNITFTTDTSKYINDLYEDEDQDNDNVMDELSKIKELENMTIDNIRNFINDNLTDYNFIEKNDILIFKELKKNTNIIIICTKEIVYQKVKFVSFEENKNKIVVRSNRLYCDIDLNDDYVFCYKNDKMGQRQVMELLLKAIESGDIIINKTEKDNKKDTKIESRYTMNSRTKVEQILNNKVNNSLLINLDDKVETRKVYIEYASNIGEKELLLEMDE